LVSTFLIVLAVPCLHAQAEAKIGDRVRITSPEVPGGLTVGVVERATSDSVVPGDRIRVGGDVPGGTLIGTFVRSTQDSVWVQRLDRPDTVSVALGSGTRLERSLGRRSRAGMGALIGAGVGAALTVAFLSGFCGGDTLCNGDEQVIAVVVFGLPPVAIGAGIGALIRVEHWAPITLGAPGTSGSRPSPVPPFQLGRLQVGIQVPW
jgi:hypothetical protein